MTTRSVDPATADLIARVRTLNPEMADILLDMEATKVTAEEQARVAAFNAEQRRRLDRGEPAQGFYAVTEDHRPVDVTEEFRSYRLKPPYPEPEISADEGTLIVLTAVVARCGRNRRLRYLLVKRAPNYGWGHVFDRWPRHTAKILEELAELGHSFTVEVEYEEVSIADWCWSGGFEDG